MRTLLIIFFFGVYQAQATNYFVSLAGSGSNNGTSSATPWNLAKLNSFTGLSGGDTVRFNWADKWVASQLLMGRTGSIGNPIVYTYYNRGAGAAPTFSGYTAVSTWTSYGGGIYGAACAGIKQTCRNVLLDGSQQPLCRYPNSGYLTYSSASNSPATLNTGLTGTPSYVGCGMTVRSSHFTFDSATVTGQSTGTLTLTGSLSYLNVGATGFFFTKRMDLMDQVGEWMPSPGSDSLRMFFGGGGPTGHTVYASVVDTVCLITGAHIKVIGLIFEGGGLYNAFSPFGSGDITFDSCTFQNGFDGVDLFVTNCSVTNCIFSNLTNNGITGAQGNVSKYMVVSGNTISNIGTISGMGRPGNAGNYMGIRNNADGCVYSGNTVKNVGYIGIYFSGDSTCVLYNFVDSFCTVLDDGGGIYTWDGSFVSYSNRRRVIGNYVSNGVGTIQGVTPDQASSASGFYFDGHSQSVLVDSNTSISSWTAGYFIHGSDLVMRHNTAYDNKYAQLFQSEFSGIAITNNLIKSNFFSSPDSSVPCIRYQTPGTDIATMATTDSNYYASAAGAVQSFWTKSSGDPGTLRSFAGWKSYLSADAHAAFQTGKLVLAGNTGFSAGNIYLTGKYRDLLGNIYVQMITLNKVQGAALFELDNGILSRPMGAILKAN